MRAGNRFCILPMEGWDGSPSGEPTELTERRWRHFGASGAKLIWGSEAAAVRHDGRANPRQLVIGEPTWPALARLREALVATHEERHGKGAADDLVVGLQITHSGRYSKPNHWDRSEPLAAWHHPFLDRRFPGGVRILCDEELDRLVDGLRARRGFRAQGRLRLRGRQALPRLPGPRAPRRRATARAATADRSRTEPASCAR